MLGLRHLSFYSVTLLWMFQVNVCAIVPNINGANRNTTTGNSLTNKPTASNETFDNKQSTNRHTEINAGAQRSPLSDATLLEEFLDLHVKACGQVELCTLRTEPTSAWPPDNDPTACCRACSCEDGCRRNGNCCPDYQFFKTAGNVTFNNVTQLLAAVENTEMNGESMFKATSQSVNMNGECIRLQVASAESTGPRGREYIMITSCLNVYTNTTVSDQCQHPDSSFYNNVPVYSKHTEKSYKNINCALCNDVTSTDLIYWQPIMLVKYLAYQGAPYDDLDALLEHLRIERSRNLVFEPDNPSIKAERCTLVTKDTCPATHVVNGTSYLREMCERFYLPVDGIQFERQTFRNIACYQCDAVTQFSKRFCFSQSQRWPTFSMYIDMSQHGNARSGSVDTLRAVFDESDRCDRGYMFDSNQGVCRKVLCQRNFYIANGRCRPIFNKIVGPRYRTMMRMELTQETRRTNTSEQLVQIISDFLSHVLTETTKLANFSFALYEKPNDYYIIILNFSFENDVSYLQKVLETVEEIVQRLSSHPKVKVVEIYSTSFENTVENMTVYDLQTGNKLLTWIPAQPDGRTFISSRLDFCYRVRLTTREIKVGMRQSVIAASGLKIANADSETDMASNVIVCIGNFPQPQSVGTSSTSTSTSTTTERNTIPVDDHGTWLSVLTKCLIAAIVILILLLICIVGVRRKTRNRRSSSSTAGADTRVNVSRA